MSDLYQTSADLMAATQDLARIERPAAALTLTRTNTLAITTAGTTITWESATRSQGFTWATTDITIPTSGYYGINFAYSAFPTVHTSYMFIRINGVNITYMAASNVPSATAHAFTAVRYMVTGDVLSLRVVPSVNATMIVIAENSNGESPILHVVQLTGVVS